MNTVIPFHPRDHVLNRARDVMEDMDRFMEDPDEAVTVLLKALNPADAEMTGKIILLLGGVAPDRVAWPLYGVMTDSSTTEEIRLQAAVQLCVTAGRLADPASLRDRLLADLFDPEPERRQNAALALGWEGNTAAALALMDLLYDEDPDVQLTAVSALANLRDDRIVGLFRDRFKNGPLEQKKAILYNLWRFSGKKKEVVAFYRSVLNHRFAELREDALHLLGLVCTPGELAEICPVLFNDPEPAIRAEALRMLKDFSPATGGRIIDRVRAMVNDPVEDVRRAAAAVLAAWKFPAPARNGGD